MMTMRLERAKKDIWQRKAKELGYTDEEYQAFLRDYAVEVVDPRTGDVTLRPFANYNDPAKAYEVAEALLERKTRPQYERKVDQAAIQKADAQAKKKVARALPQGTSPKPEPPPDEGRAYIEGIRAIGEEDNPDNWV